MLLCVVLFATVVVVFGVPSSARLSCLFSMYDGIRLVAIMIATLLVGALTHVRAHRWVATLASASLAALATFMLSFAIIPGGRGVPQRARAAVAMSQMRAIAGQLHAGRPTGLIDPWCHPYEIAASPSGYTVISYGQDGVRDVPLGEPYPNGPATSYTNDLVFTAGRFTRYPEGLIP